jgi:adenylyltransferase/sulfurtransferase
MSFEYVKLKKDPNCKICGPHPEVTELIDYEAYCGVPGYDHAAVPTENDREISVLELAERLKRGDKLGLIDVREPHELRVSSLPGALNIPLGVLASRLSELDSAQELVLFCRSGTRSQRGLELLLSAGFEKVKNLRGGINAWAREVDTKLPIY